MTDIQKRLNAVTDKLAELKEESRKVFAEAISSMFKTHPEVKMIVWSGWVPYFNDGEECIFGLHGVGFLNTEVDSEGPFYEDYGIVDIEHEEREDISIGDKDWENTHLGEDMQALRNFMYQNTHLIQDLYGNHHSVKITADKVEVIEYTDHD